MTDTTTNYPIRPRPDDDPRFTHGLFADFAKLLEQHGYARPDSASDWARVSSTLYGFIYGEQSE